MENINKIDSLDNFSHKSFALKSYAIIVSTFLLSGIITTLLQDFIPEQFKKDFLIYSQGVIQLIIFLYLSIILSKQSPLSRKTIFRLNNVLDLRIITLSVIGILGLQIFSTGYLSLQQHLIPDSFMEIYKKLQDFIENSYKDLLGGNGLLQFMRSVLIGAMIPAISEEFFFRGLIQKSFEQELKVTNSIIFTALLFAVIHLNLVDLIPLIAIGIYLGLLAYKTQNIWVPVIAHFSNNFIAVIILYNKSLIDIEDNTKNLQTIDSIVILNIGLIIVIIALYLIVKLQAPKLYRTIED